jgi:hypothetical protein
MSFANRGIVICVERGSLEYKALCLVLTLRGNWGAWSNTPVYSYSPREGRGISAWLATIFQAYGVTIVEEPINTKYYDYPLANKPLCMAHAERQKRHDLLVFLDSDVLCWREPTDFALAEGKNLGIVMDTTKSAATAGPGDVNAPMWEQLFELVGAKEIPWVTTTLSQERVKAWWGTSVRAEAGLMGEWLDIFERAFETVSFRPQANYLREQMTLCALAAREHEHVQDMSVGHNFPVQNHKAFMQRGIDARDAVLWHYQPYLNKAFRKFAERLDSISSVAAKEKAARAFIEDLRVNYPRRIGLDEPFHAELRRRLRLGPRIRSLLGKS